MSKISDNWIAAIRRFWWSVILCALSGLVIQRWDPIVAGNPTMFDALALLLWLGVALSPLYTEIGLFGVKLKREVDRLRSETATQIANLRADFRNTVDARSVANAHISFPAYGSPPPAEDIPRIEEQVERAVRATLESYGIQQPVPGIDTAEVPDDSLYLFHVRYNIERELRRVSARLPDADSRSSVARVLNSLLLTETLPANVIYAIREVYRICTLAIHGEDVRPERIAFVRRTAPELLTSLRAIGEAVPA